MAREIEIKIPLTDIEYDSLYAGVFSKKCFEGVTFENNVEHLLKSDKYFSRYDTRQERTNAVRQDNTLLFIFAPP